MINIKNSLFAILFLCSCFSASANDECQSCHQKQTSDWKQSDHASSMALANKDTVLGDFNNVTATHFSQKAVFYKEKDAFLVNLTEQGTKKTYTVNYVFGFDPLQQYLIEVEKGKYQVFPFAWDSRAKALGGQRWYANYANEDVKPNDRLHWLQPLQNWNGMCADCHSDNLKRNYNTEKESFDTHFSNINVGCKSCHNNITDEHKTKKIIKAAQTSPTNMSQWKIIGDNKIATWQGEPRDNSFMQGCYACHSLRSPLTDGFDNNQAFLDQFSPSFLEPNLYHADGQIKEEVYVFGSFAQSKMYKAGVNCVDCHDKHTMKVKTKTNGLCLQCHSASEYNKPEHHRHKEQSTGAQCVSCHMPTTRYMGVDDRRDHSFKIPRPDISIKYDTPNACVQCHDGQTNEWAASTLEKWHGKAPALSASEHSMLELRSLKAISQNAHMRLINDFSLNEIDRASAISYLGNSGAELNDATVKSWVNSPLPLIRLAIAKVGFLLPEAERLKSYKQLLTDKLKSVRVAAAQNLSQTATQISGLNQSIIELAHANNVNTWRGEGNINQSMLALNKQDINGAIESLQKGISVDFYFDASYVNLADIYYRLGQTEKMQSVLNNGLTAVPSSAPLHYANGMALIRSGNKPAAVGSFKHAMALESNNVQYAYLYFLALDSIGATAQAVSELKSKISTYNNAVKLKSLGMSFTKKLKNAEGYQFFKQLK
ncbi:hypothetical protein LOS73_13175 [Pseudoalteromonas sp. SCSIO 43210]